MGPVMGKENCKEATVMSQNWSVEWVSMGEGTYVICSGLCTNFKQTEFTFSKQADKHSFREEKELIKEGEVRGCSVPLLPFLPQQLSQGIDYWGDTHLIPTDDLCRGKGQPPLPNSLPSCLGENGFLSKSWHSAQASLCNPRSHRLEANCSSSPASADSEAREWDWSWFLHLPGASFPFV